MRQPVNAARGLPIKYCSDKESVSPNKILSIKLTREFNRHS